MLDFGLEPIATAPPSLLFGFAAFVVTVAGAALAGLDAGMARAAFSEERRLRIVRRTGASLAAWFLFLAMSSVSGLYLGAASPRFLLYAVPALVAVVVLFRCRWLETAVLAMPVWWIPLLQVLRVGGGASLVAAWAIGLAPWGFVRIAAVGDILVGVGGAATAWVLAKPLRGSRRVAVAWNVLGLLDILHTVFRGGASAAGPQRLFFEEPVNLIPAVFPFVYLPGFIVPVTILLHLLSLRQLGGAAAGPRTVTPR